MIRQALLTDIEESLKALYGAACTVTDACTSPPKLSELRAVGLPFLGFLLRTYSDKMRADRNNHSILLLY